mgnify:FL=1
MTSALYASLSAFIIVWLSLNVIKTRRERKISIGDGDDTRLRIAIAAQLNAVEYIPIALLLLILLEYNGANLVVVHIFGLLLITGRVIHASAILTENMNNRVRGMQITIWVLIGLAIANLLFLPYDKYV